MLDCYLEDIRRHGFLRCGYGVDYLAAETFMRTIASEVSCEYAKLAVEMSLAGKDVKLELDAIPRHACCSIFNKCVLHGDFFNEFLKKCAETGLFDSWFMSEDFMSNVWAGSIKGNWCILFDHENNDKGPYRRRFRKFIESLDNRGLKWTESYLKPDSFWGQKLPYWTET